MGVCAKCQGRGFVENPKHYGKYGRDHQYDPTKQCASCKGGGWQMDGLKDALHILRVWKNNPRGITDKEFSEAVEILDKVFEK